MLVKADIAKEDRSRAGLILAAVLVAGAVLPVALNNVPSLAPGTAALDAHSATLANTSVQRVSLPLQFEPNAGQTDKSVDFVARASGGTMFFRPAEVVMSLPVEGAKSNARAAVAVQFVGANANHVIEGEGALPGKASYLKGNNPARWQKGLPTYAAVEYTGVYDGVNLKYEGDQGSLKGTYLLAPGTDPSIIRWRYTGAEQIVLQPGGDLKISIAGAEAALTEKAPVAWQEIAGQRTPVSVAYTVGEDGTAGFAVGAYNGALPLTIDPTISYSTFLGGDNFDDAIGIAVDSQGYTYVAGHTDSLNFPLVNARDPIYGGNSDAYVTKLAPGGQNVIYSTYLGGNDVDYAFDVDVDASGNAYVTGRTASDDFPVAGAYRPVTDGSNDAYLTKLDPNGQGVLYSTFFGGSEDEQGWGVAVDGAANAYIVGETSSADFSTRSAYDSTINGGTDGYVAKINTAASGDASLVYSTFLGGSSNDFAGGRVLLEVGHGIAVDDLGYAYLAGQTQSADFPTRNAFDTTYGANGNRDGWVALIDTELAGDASLVYSSYLGDTGSDAANDIAVDAEGYAYVTGTSGSVNFPQRNHYANCFGNAGPFVAKFNMFEAGDASLVYSTCFGPGGIGSASAVAVDAYGQAYITGDTRSNTFPVRFPVQGNLRGFSDAYVLKLSENGNLLGYSTYLGGDSTETGTDIDVDAQGNAYIAGTTFSTNFPTQSAYQPTYGGDGDGYVTRLAPEGTSCAISFTDVQPGSTFHPYVQCLACRDVIGGYSDGTFRPNADVTRGQLSKIVANAAGFSEAVTGQSFTDVPPSHTFYLYIERMARRGIINGYSDGTFRPHNNATRGQIAKIVSNSVGYSWEPTGQAFTDVPPTHAFYVFVERLVHEGVIGGYSDGTFRPQNNATRGQVSKIVSLGFFPECGANGPSQAPAPVQPKAPVAPETKSPETKAPGSK
ncbi:MAG TPA: S-layer homology domain-containing protein [Chloroflexia bacterium]|nr:S-layer homology domain-containing protein [Chloroflexia bacterium]